MAAALADDDVNRDTCHFLDWSISIRRRILEKASSQSNLFSKSFELPRCDDDLIGPYKNFSFSISAKYSTSENGASSELKVRELTEQNLGWTRVLFGNCLQDINEWVKMLRHDQFSRLLLLETVEFTMWEFAKNFPVMT